MADKGQTATRDSSLSTENIEKPSTPGVHRSPTEGSKTLLATDLSDPTSYELLDEDGAERPLLPDDRYESRRYKVQKSLLSYELTHQKGVLIMKREIVAPGRVGVLFFSILNTLGVIFGFFSGLIHFSVYSPNYIIPVFVLSVLLFAQVVIYDSSYRCQRLAMCILQVIGTLIFMAGIDFAFWDLLAHPVAADQRRFLLILALVCFNIVPVLMIAHAVYFGRGKRTIHIKRNVKGNNKPTVVMDKAKPDNKPTVVMDKAKPDHNPKRSSAPQPTSAPPMADASKADAPPKNSNTLLQKQKSDA